MVTPTHLKYDKKVINKQYNNVRAREGNYEKDIIVDDNRDTGADELSRDARGTLRP
jgi:hypothetical protein